MSPPIAILGAGASGLLLARLLEINNFDYVVYEQDGPDLDPKENGTFDCLDGVVRALKEAHLYPEYERVARFIPQYIGAFDHRGEVITRNEIEVPSIDWCDIRAMLLKSIPAERIRWHCKFEKVEKGAEGKPVVTFSSGKVEKDFKLIVGADGRFSKVRHLVTPVQPKYFGVTYLRTSISHDSGFWSTVQAQEGGPSTYISVGQQKQIVGMLNVAGTYTIYIGQKIPEHHYPPTAVQDAAAFRKHLVDHELAGYKSSVLNYVRHSDGPFTMWPQYSMPSDSLSWETVPGIALVGDAAHPTLPWPGESLAAVLTDSLELGQQIVKLGMDRLDRAVTEYERVMFPRRKKYIEKCTELGELFYSRDAAHTIEYLLGAVSQDE